MKKNIKIAYMFTLCFGLTSSMKCPYEAGVTGYTTHEDTPEQRASDETIAQGQEERARHADLPIPKTLLEYDGQKKTLGTTTDSESAPRSPEPKKSHTHLKVQYPDQRVIDAQKAKEPKSISGLDFETITKTHYKKFVDWIQNLLSIGDESKATAKFVGNANSIAGGTYDTSKDTELELNFKTLDLAQKERVFNSWLQSREKYYNDLKQNIKDSSSANKIINLKDDSRKDQIDTLNKQFQDEITRVAESMRYFLSPDQALVPVKDSDGSMKFEVVDMSKIDITSKSNTLMQLELINDNPENQVSHNILNDDVATFNAKKIGKLDTSKPLLKQIKNKFDYWGIVDSEMQQNILEKLGVQGRYNAEIAKNKVDWDTEFENQRNIANQKVRTSIETVKDSVKLAKNPNLSGEQVKQDIESQLNKNQTFIHLSDVNKETIINGLLSKYNETKIEQSQKVRQRIKNEMADDLAKIKIRNDENTAREKLVKEQESARARLLEAQQKAHQELIDNVRKQAVAKEIINSFALPIRYENKFPHSEAISMYADLESVSGFKSLDKTTKETILRQLMKKWETQPIIEKESEEDKEISKMSPEQIEKGMLEAIENPLQVSLEKNAKKDIETQMEKLNGYDKLTDSQKKSILDKALGKWKEIKEESRKSQIQEQMNRINEIQMSKFPKNSTNTFLKPNTYQNPINLSNISITKGYVKPEETNSNTQDSTSSNTQGDVHAVD